MKKTRLCMFLLIAVVIIMCNIVGCAKKAVNLEHLSIEYAEIDNYINKGKNINDSINDYFFEEGTNKGIIAKITASEYSFFYNVHCDEDTGKVLIDGYAECACFIEKTSKNYNNSEYKEGDSIIVRQNIFLEPLNDNALSKMFKDIGAYKDSNVVVGLFKANNNLINENDYRLLISESTIVLSEKQSYYAFITIDNGIPYISLICSKNEEMTHTIPADVLLSMSNFKGFLLENDMDIFN